MSTGGQTLSTGPGDAVDAGELQAATVRDLILELAQVEYTLRQAAVSGDSTDVGAADGGTELAEREAAIVAELRARRMPFTLGRGALTVSPGLGRPDRPRPDDEETVMPTHPVSSGHHERRDDIVQPAAGEDAGGEDAGGEDAGGEDKEQSARVDQLRLAVESRTVIGQAQGILMSRYRLSADEAFERLRITSQDQNRKLRAVAADLVAGTPSGVTSGDRVERALSTREVVGQAQGILMERHRDADRAWRCRSGLPAPPGSDVT